MKLKLNRTLRAALIAAITAVGSFSFSIGTIAVATGAAIFTGQQAQAEDVTIALPTERGYQFANASGGAIAAGSNLTATISTVAENSNMLSGTGAFADKNGVYVGGNNGSFGYDHNATGTEGMLTLEEDDTLTLDVWGRSGKSGETVVYVLNPADLQAGVYLNSLTFNATKDCATSIGIGLAVVKADGSGIVKSQVLDTITGTNPAPGSVSITNLEWSDDYRILALVRGAGSGTASNPVKKISLTATLGQAPENYTWCGTSGDYAWSSDVWKKGDQTGQSFASGANAVFDGTVGVYTTVTIDSAVTANNVTVGGQDYTFNVSGSGSLTADLLLVTDHTLALGDASYNIGSLEISDGAVVTTTRSNGTAAVTGDIVINEGGTFKVLGGHDAFGYEGGQTDNIIMTGSANHLATLELHQTTENSVTMQTNIQMNGYSQITDVGTHRKGFNTFGGNISVTGTNNTIEHMSLRKPVTVDVANGGELVINTLDNDKIDDTRNLTKTGAGSMTVTNSSATLNDLYLNGGKLTFSSGTTTVKGKLMNDNVAVNSELVVGTDAQHTAILKVNRLENGNVNNNNTHSDVTVNTGSTLKITGSSTETGYKNASLVLGEWNVQTKADIMGTLIAENVSIVGGDSGYVMNINGGTVLVKGLRRDGTKNPNHRINITNGGNLILGADGIVASNAGNGGTTTVNDGTIGIYADSVTIDKNITLSGAATFDTQKYTVNDTTVSQGTDGGQLTISGVLSGSGSLIKAGVGTLTLSGANTYTGDTVVNGGTLDIQGSISADSKVKVAQDATLTGNIEDITMGIEAGKTATIVDSWGFTPKETELTFFSESGEVKVQNTGDTEITYGIGEEKAKVTADSLMSGESGDSPVVVNNELVVKSIAHEGTGELTLAHVNADELKGVYAYDGALSLQNIAEVRLTEMTIAPEATVAVYQGGLADANQEGTVTITDTLTAGGGTLLANLTMADGSTLDVKGGNTMALTLGSLFTIANGALVNLDEATLSAIADLENIGDKVILIKQYGDHELTTNLADGDWARAHFDLSSITDADYKMYVQDGQIGLVKSSMVPEPTTGTLSLLALMALAARRRRK